MKNFYTALLIIISIPSISQNINGEYIGGVQYFNFSNDSVSFFYSDNGGLIQYRYGKGVYKIFKDFLLIETKEYDGNKSVYYAKEKESNESRINVIDYDNENIDFASVLGYDSNNEIIWVGAAKGYKQIKVEKHTEIKHLEVNLLGYDKISFTYNPKMDYTIKLGLCCVYENRTLLFKIMANDGNILWLQEITLDFSGTELNNKTIRKIERSNNERQNITIGLIKK